MPVYSQAGLKKLVGEIKSTEEKIREGLPKHLSVEYDDRGDIVGLGMTTESF